MTAARGLYRQAVALALAAPPSAADADGDDGGCGAAVRLLLEAASLEQRTGELSEARDLLGQAAAAAPASTSVKVAQARLASAAGEVGEMRRILAEAAQLPAADDSDDGSGGFSQVYNAWAALEAHHGHERAAAVLEEATARYLEGRCAAAEPRAAAGAARATPTVRDRSTRRRVRSRRAWRPTWRGPVSRSGRATRRRRGTSTPRLMRSMRTTAL